MATKTDCGGPNVHKKVILIDKCLLITEED